MNQLCTMVHCVCGNPFAFNWIECDAFRDIQLPWIAKAHKSCEFDSQREMNNEYLWIYPMQSLLDQINQRFVSFSVFVHICTVSWCQMYLQPLIRPSNTVVYAFWEKPSLLCLCMHVSLRLNYYYRKKHLRDAYAKPYFEW